MPFGIFRREAEAPPVVAIAPVRRPPRFEGLTEDWRIRAELRIDGRLADVLNRRQPFGIGDVDWGPADGSAALEPAPGLRSVDPYDLIVVMAGADGPALQTEIERTAVGLQRTAYDVVLDAPPFRVAGTVHMLPGTNPGRLLDRSSELFVAVTQPAIFFGERRLADRPEAVLVNRSYLRDVREGDPPGG